MEPSTTTASAATVEDVDRLHGFSRVAGLLQLGDLLRSPDSVDIIESLLFQMSQNHPESTQTLAGKKGRLPRPLTNSLSLKRKADTVDADRSVEEPWNISSGAHRSGSHASTPREEEDGCTARSAKHRKVNRREEEDDDELPEVRAMFELLQKQIPESTAFSSASCSTAHDEEESSDQRLEAREVIIDRAVRYLGHLIVQYEQYEGECDGLQQNLQQLMDVTQT